MKKPISVFVFTLAFVGIVFGASQREEIMVKILAVKVREFISPEFIAKVIDGKTSILDRESADFHSAYYVCRSTAYKELFVPGFKDWDEYYLLRTVTVAKIKGELHSGDTLLKVYEKCRPTILSGITRQNPEFQKNLNLSIEIGIAAFEMVKDQDTRRRMALTFEGLGRQKYGDGLVNEVEVMLMKNNSAMEIAERIVKGSPALNNEYFIEMPDHDTFKFALRRWNEGGAELVEKYLVVLRQAKADFAAAAVQ